MALVYFRTPDKFDNQLKNFILVMILELLYKCSPNFLASSLLFLYSLEVANLYNFKLK